MKLGQLWHITRMRIRSLLRWASVEQEMDEELRFHLENKIAEGVANGLTEKEARQAAMRALDGMEVRKEEMRDMRHLHWLTDFVDDVRYALRSLRRTPGMTLFVIFTLALGIGIVSAIFPLFDGLVLRPLPVAHPGEILTLFSTTPDEHFANFSYREYLDIRDQSKSYDGIIANTGLETVGFAADLKALPRVKGGIRVSGNFFHVLGVEPQLGRAFREDEDQVPGRDAVTVLGYDFWKNEFNGDSAVLGRKIRLNGTEFTVIGVAPERFPGLSIFGHPDFYEPLAMSRIFTTTPQKDFFEDRDDRQLDVRARLKPGVALSQARGELDSLAKYFQREYPALNRTRGAAIYTEFERRTRPDADEWKFGTTFIILALAVLLVACTNVAGLLLSRARSRTREIAVRLAIGAGRFRLIRLLMTESLILAGLGGLLGIAMGYGGVLYWQHFKLASDLPETVPVHMDYRVMVAGLALSVLSALLCGLVPALQSSRADLVTGLKAADVDQGGRKRLWGRNALVVVQVAASLMLLTAAFLMVRGFRRTWDLGAGYTTDHLLMATFDPRLVQYDPAQTQRFYKLLAERLRQTSGVQSVGLTQNIPLGYEGWEGLAFVPEGFQLPPDRENFSSTVGSVDEGFFTTMGIPLLSGRGFLESDTPEAPRVAVINQQFALHYWPNADAVGQHIRLDNRNGPLVEIVGVARTIKYLDPNEKPRDFIYLPLPQHPQARMSLMLHSHGDDPLQLMAPMKEVVRNLDPNMPLFEAGSFEQFYKSQAVGGGIVAVELVTTMGAVGLLLAVAGLYGLVAYNVSRRTREIGIRMAIGAGRSDVLRLVMGKGLVLVGIGTLLGVAMGFGVERLFNAMLFNSGGVDILAYVIVVPVLFAVTALAAYVPARRATRIAPTQALRYE
jgi:macrolide transport system ATP-binding/permease protein